MRYLWIAVIMAFATVASAAIDEQTTMPAPWHCRAGDVVRIHLVDESRQHGHSEYLSGRIVRILPDEQVKLEVEREVLMNGARRRVTLRAVAKISDFHSGNRILSSSLQGIELYFDSALSAPPAEPRGSLLRLLSRIF